MFVGEAPGEDEDLQGEPFVGRAGQLLTKMIVAMGLTREQVYIANILKCRPDMPPGSSGNRKPTREEMDTCLPYLRAQIDVIQPQVHGRARRHGGRGPARRRSAASAGCAENSSSTAASRSCRRTIPPTCCATPSNTEKRKVWEDLLQVMERLGHAHQRKAARLFSWRSSASRIPVSGSLRSPSEGRMTDARPLRIRHP